MGTLARIIGAYSIFGFAWIFFSDALVLQIFGANLELLSYAQNAKGSFYIILTSLLLGILLYYELRRYQKKEADFEQLFHNNPQPMWIYSLASLRFLEVNHAAISKYGYSRDNFLQMSILDIRPPEDVPQLLAEIKRDFFSSRETGDWRHRNRAGQVFTVKMLLYPLDYHGEEAILATVLDVTEERRRENHRRESEALRIELEKEKAASQRRQRFVSMVSHEFRNPLTSISNSIGIMEQMGEKLDETRRSKHFKKISEQVKHLVELLDEMLAILRTEASNSNFQPKMLNLKEFCQQEIESIQSSYPNSARIEFIPAGAEIKAEVDIKLMRCILENLLGNAIKYSPNGGKIRLELSQNATNFHLQIRDEGIGIPADNLPLLFEPFFRATNTGRIQGTGLGLAIVKQAVQLHAGEITVESEENIGTSFLIKMPLHQAQTKALELIDST